MIQSIQDKKLHVVFFCQGSGKEPVLEFLRALPKEDRTTIGHDIKVVEFGWPLGLPLVKHIQEGIWEIRSHLPSKRIARVLFCLEEDCLVILHGFIKKTQKLPKADLTLAKKRKALLEK